MLSKFAIVALLGLTASALPNSPREADAAPQVDSLETRSERPFTFPLANGFPHIQIPSDALIAIEKQAHGSLPNGDLPKKIADVSAIVLQLITFNEFFEVAYFTTILNRIKDGTYNLGYGRAKDIVVHALKTVQAQEQLHALGANALLKSAGREQVKPCKYRIPQVSFDAAIELASTFTDLVLGTLQDALEEFGTHGDVELLALVGSVIGQEGEQNGFYRSFGGKVPSQLPFLTRSNGHFAFSALNQLFIVPGSCPNANLIPIPVLGALTVLTYPVQAQDQQIAFKVKKGGPWKSNFHVVYINQQNLPIVEAITNIHDKGDEWEFSANFPYNANFMNGLTITIIVEGSGPFNDVKAATDAAKYGPGLIEVQ